MMDTSTNSYEDRLLRSELLYREGMHALSKMPEVAQLAGKKVCVVGCTGLIGSVLIEILEVANSTILHDNPIKVWGVARQSPKHAAESPTCFIAKSASAVTEDEVSACDYIIYVAGAASDYLSRIPQIIETQFVGLQKFLDFTARCTGFVFLSSTRVYGRQSGTTFIVEDQVATVSPMHLDNIYDAHKRFAESLCLWYAQKKAMPVSVARISNVYGSQEELRSETVISDFVRQALKTQHIVIKSPHSVRNYCSVLDIAQGLFKLLVNGRRGHAYNIGSHEHMTSHDLSKLIRNAMSPSAGAIDIETSIDVNPSQQYISIERAKAEVGFDPQFTFEMLSHMVVSRTRQGVENRLKA